MEPITLTLQLLTMLRFNVKWQFRVLTDFLTKFKFSLMIRCQVYSNYVSRSVLLNRSAATQKWAVKFFQVCRRILKCQRKYAKEPYFNYFGLSFIVRWAANFFITNIVCCKLKNHCYWSCISTRSNLCSILISFVVVRMAKNCQVSPIEKKTVGSNY